MYYNRYNSNFLIFLKLNYIGDKMQDTKIIKDSVIKIMPAVALKGKVVLPNVYTSLDVGRIQSLNAINASIKEEKLLFVVSQKDKTLELPKSDDLYTIGTVCRVGNLSKINGENYRVTIEGLYRAKILMQDNSVNYFCFKVEELETIKGDKVETEALLRNLKQIFLENASLYKLPSSLVDVIMDFEDAEEFVNAVAFNLPFKFLEKQYLLECTDEFERLNKVKELMLSEIEIVKTEKRIAESVKKSVEKGQKEFYLREQLKAIHKELGDDEEEIEKLREQIINKKLPKESQEKVLKELNKMSRMQPSSPDYTVIRSYLDWIIDLPFNTESVDTEKLVDCQKILEQDHFGLDKVKKRIVEYLAVLKLTNSLKGPILCLVGPPGVGKTSIAISIARSLNRKLVRMSLGGVKDEAEIRGHRKAYIGAMPGRIIYGMRDSGTINPVFLLDEIDKLSSDLRGDPASALLEVLDPEQNATFRDRYLEIPYDLSKVMFITTANSLDTIPAPLLDRMEVIEIQGYTLEEKVQIGLKYLCPKQIKANGLSSKHINFTESAVKEIVEGYTLEAGVRKLDQQIAKVCRRIATMLATSDDFKKQTVNKNTVKEYLGSRRFIKENQIEKDEVGSATGLAWTSLGGTTLTIEVALMKGKGVLSLTGKLGDVMQESAKTALNYIRANAEKYGINPSVFEETDVHLHVPEGATPKDGPSAGITICTAMLSAFTNKKSKRSYAMTGEITLRGNVLAIGGLKEKALSAYRLGIKDIIIPKANLKDLEEIPSEISSKITFHPVSKYDEVYKLCVEN